MPDANTPEFYRDLLSAADYAQLVAAIDRPLLPALRVNTLKISAEAARSTWPARYGWQIEPVPFCPSGWRITAGAEQLARTAEFKLGFYYLQDAASMLPVELFSVDPADEPLVLDMAAAPGGKTTHLISRQQDRGLLVANDSSASRIGPLRTNLQDWGAANTIITNSLGDLWGAWFPERFDRVLLDAPCSGQGLRAAERRAARPISDREREALQAQQIRLLESGFRALRPGGELVYATCTLHPDEDERVVAALLQRMGGAAEVAQVTTVVAAGLPAAGDPGVDPQLGRTLRIWPQLYDTSGFFAALIRKLDSVPTGRQPHPHKSLRDKNFAPLKPAVQADLLAGFLESYQFDLAAVLERQRLELWQRQQQVFAIPTLYLTQLDDLPAVATGMLIAELKGADWQISHELAARFGSSFGRGRLTIPSDQAARWLQGQELRDMDASPLPHGAVALVQDEHGRLLGRGKVLGRRVRNLLPRRLVY